MPFYRDLRTGRQVQAIRIQSDNVMGVMEFFYPVKANVEFLDHPPRVRMTEGRRSFVAHEGQWVVSPGRGAYYPIADDQFNNMFELIGD